LWLQNFINLLEDFPSVRLKIHRNIAFFFFPRANIGCTIADVEPSGAMWSQVEPVYYWNNPAENAIPLH